MCELNKSYHLESVPGVMFVMLSLSVSTPNVCLTAVGVQYSTN